jgi:hypothetical protein
LRDWLRGNTLTRSAHCDGRSLRIGVHAERSSESHRAEMLVKSFAVYYGRLQ